MAVAYFKDQVADSKSLVQDFESEGIEVFRFNAKKRYDWRFLPTFVRLLKYEQPDIVHSHLVRSDISGALVSRLIPRVPVVCTVHGMYDRHFGAWVNPLLLFAYRNSDCVIAISHAVDSWLKRTVRVSAEKVYTIQYGIDLEKFSPPNEFVHHGSPRGEPSVVGSIGRLIESKGFDCLIRAMAFVRQSHQTTLLIAGHDPFGYKPILTALIEKLDLKDQVQLLGFQSNVPLFLHSVDVFAFPSQQEGFGQVVIEAMAAGKPVVANRIAPLSEIVIDGGTGLLVEPQNPYAFAQAISWLLDHPMKAQEMGGMGRRRVQLHFSAERMGRATVALYRSVLRSRRLPV